MMNKAKLSQSHATRRGFLKTSAALAGGAFVLPRFSIGKPGQSANSKLNIAFVGVGNMGRGNLTQMTNENVVALCDVDPRELDAPWKKWTRDSLLERI